MGEPRGQTQRHDQATRDAVAALKLTGLSNFEIGMKVGLRTAAVTGLLKRLGLSMEAKLAAETARINRKGKSFRLEPKGRPGDAMRAKMSAEASAFRPKRDPKERLRYIAPQGEPVPLEQLEAGQCHWPDGDGPFRFCNAKVQPGLNYCPVHYGLGWKPSTTSTVELIRSTRRCV